LPSLKALCPCIHSSRWTPSFDIWERVGRAGEDGSRVGPVGVTPDDLEPVVVRHGAEAVLAELQYVGSANTLGCLRAELSSEEENEGVDGQCNV
jgi:hypothetical protein